MITSNFPKVWLHSFVSPDGQRLMHTVTFDKKDGEEAGAGVDGSAWHWLSSTRMEPTSETVSRPARSV